MKRKVVFVRIASSPPANVRLAEALREAFADYDFEVIELAQRIRSRPPLVVLNAMLAVLSYPVHLLTRRQTAWTSFFTTRFFFRWVQRMMPRWVDPATVLCTIQTQSLFDASIAGVPHFIFTDHTHLANLQSDYFDRRALRPDWWIALEREVYQRATLVFCRTSHVRTSFLSDYGLPEDRVLSVGSGSNVPAERYVPTLAQFEAKRLLFAGFDWKRKGGPTVLAAFRQVRQRHPDATLTIVGASPAVNQAGVQVVGPVGLDAMAGYYRNASVFVFPSRLEPFGSVVVEAMHYGLPVVATNAGPFTDVVLTGKTGELIPPDDPDALARALCALLDDPQRCLSYGAEGQQVARTRFTWPTVASRMREAIEAKLDRLNAG